jgi:hypothetical protein
MPPGRERNPTANDVRIEEAQQRSRIVVSIVRGVTAVLCVLASTFPLQWLYFAVKELAGKETKIAVGLVLTLSFVGVAESIWAVVSLVKLKNQKDELVRLRERCARLENELRQHTSAIVQEEEQA